VGDESHELTSERLREPARVVRRALVLSAVVCRGAIDYGAGQPEAEALNQRILEWLSALELRDDVEPWENEVLYCRLGGLAENQVIRATWYVEGLVILAWALNQYLLPRHDRKSDPYAVTDSLLFLSEGAGDLIRTASLRSVAQLKAYRELIYAVHCRLRDYARKKEHKDFTTWVETDWIRALGLNVSDLFVEKDLGIDNKPLRDVEDNRLQECEWISCERHRAIIWLLGEHARFSETRVDT
jgi:uncharacterized protein DUF4272